MVDLLLCQGSIPIRKTGEALDKTHDPWLTRQVD